MTTADRLPEIVKAGGILITPEYPPIPVWSAEILPTDPPALFVVKVGCQDQTGIRFRLFAEVRTAGLGLEFDTLPDTARKMWLYPVTDLPDYSTDDFEAMRGAFAADLARRDRPDEFQALVDGEREAVLRAIAAGPPA